MIFSIVKMGDRIVIVVENGDELLCFIPRTLKPLEKDQEEGDTHAHTHTHTRARARKHTHTYSSRLWHTHTFPHVTRTHIYISELSSCNQMHKKSSKYVSSLLCSCLLYWRHTHRHTDTHTIRQRTFKVKLELLSTPESPLMAFMLRARHPLFDTLCLMPTCWHSLMPAYARCWTLLASASSVEEHKHASRASWLNWHLSAFSSMMLLSLIYIIDAGFRMSYIAVSCLKCNYCASN